MEWKRILKSNHRKIGILQSDSRDQNCENCVNLFSRFISQGPPFVCWYILRAPTALQNTYNQLQQYNIIIINIISFVCWIKWMWKKKQHKTFEDGRCGSAFHWSKGCVTEDINCKQVAWVKH